MKNEIGRIGLSMFSLLLVSLVWGAEPPRTEITKWQDGKQACVSLTYDDATVNQFKIAVPLMNERNFQGTFFIITGDMQDVRYRASFVGRPIMDIVRESEKVPSTKENVLERTSMIRYLRDFERVEETRSFNLSRVGRFIEQGAYDELGRSVDEVLAKIRQSGATYAVRDVAYSGNNSHEKMSWDDFRKCAAQGHEFAAHTITHPYLAALDNANILYEVERCRDDILTQLGPKHTFSFEGPYGTEDPRVFAIISKRFPLTRNGVTDSFMDGIMRGDSRDPAESKKEYVQWQRGAVTKTPVETLNGWVDKSIQHGTWLVLVFHGIDGIGWEALPSERVRNYFDYIKAHESQVWVATFQDGAKYARERMSSKVTTKRDRDVIEVSVTHPLDPASYDLPLTARTIVPDGWKTARFRQGNDTRSISVQREANNSYVLYRLQPNGKAVTLERGAD